MHDTATRLSSGRIGDVARDLAARAIEVRLFDSALALASRLFVAVIPMALLVTSLLPTDAFADRLVTGLQLKGAGRAAAERLFATPDAVRAGMTAVTCLVVTYSLMSCAGVLQRTYRVVWRLSAPQGAGWKTEAKHRLGWAAVLVTYVGATFTFADAGSGSFVTTLREAGRTVLAVAFFGWTPYILLGRRIPPRQLLPTAVLSAVFVGALTAAAPIYIPRLASASAASYGLVGFAFTFLTLLYAHALLIVAAAVAGAAIGDRPRAGTPHPRRTPSATDPAPAPPSMESPCR